MLLDLGCGSGLSGEALSEAGHVWVVRQCPPCHPAGAALLHAITAGAAYDARIRMLPCAHQHACMHARPPLQEPLMIPSLELSSRSCMQVADHGTATACRRHVHGLTAECPFCHKGHHRTCAGHGHQRRHAGRGPGGRGGGRPVPARPGRGAAAARGRLRRRHLHLCSAVALQRCANPRIAPCSSRSSLQSTCMRGRSGCWCHHHCRCAPEKCKARGDPKPAAQDQAGPSACMDWPPGHACRLSAHREAAAAAGLSTDERMHMHAGLDRCRPTQAHAALLREPPRLPGLRRPRGAAGSCMHAPGS